MEVASSSLVSRSIREFSSAGRASALQAEGQRFESVNSHHGPVVQLVRTLACHARGRRFEPDPGRHLFSAFLDRKSGEKRKIMVDFPNNLW